MQAQVYNFPVKPGTEEWNNLETEADRLEALQIPENLLSTMSTQDLIITCLNYPAMAYFSAYNNPQDGMNVIIQRFNGLKELMKRSDAPNILLSTYKEMGTKMALNKQDLNQFFWSIRRCYFEWLLAQDDIIDKMSDEDKSELMKDAIEKLYTKIDKQEEYSGIDYQPTLTILSKVQKKITNKSNLNIENSALEQLITKSLSSFPSEDYNAYTIYTPNGTAITAGQLIAGKELTNSQKEEAKNQWLDYYNNRITYAGEATRTYNCHAYAWYCSEGHSYVWINHPDDDVFWEDGSFVLTTTPDENSKVSFPLDDHSAIMTSQSGYFKSKWGKSPLFIHTRNDCPYPVSTTLNYYRYPDPTYNTVPSKPTVVSFKKESEASFSASVTNNSNYNVDQYEWRIDYPTDWYTVPQNTSQSSVIVWRGTSNPRSCNLSARGHNNYGWGEWQVVGWLYSTASNSYELSAIQNASTLEIQIKPISDETEIKSIKNINLTKQTYAIGLYSSRGTCVYQSAINNSGSNTLKLNINISSLPNGIYILHVQNTKASEDPQTLNISIKH